MRRNFLSFSSALFLLSFGSAVPVAAQGQLKVTISNAYNLIVDSNVTAPSTYAPRAGFIGANICNVGNAALANVVANIGNFDAGRVITVTRTAGSKTLTSSSLFVATDGGLRVSGAGIPLGASITAFTSTSSVTMSVAATSSGTSTIALSAAPGIFPVKTFGADALRPHLANTGSYSLSLASSLSEGSRYIGTLAAGQCRVQFWLFTYPACVNQSGASQNPPCTTSITGGVGPEDDLTLDYDVWATTTTPSVATTAQTRSFTMRNEISAAANKIWPNTTSKVPDSYLTAIQSVVGWGTIGPDGQPLSETNSVYPGQRVITTQGIWYDLGNVGQGFDNDGDLLPDQNAWLQPVGDAAQFDANCFRMVGVYGIVVVKLKTGGELLIPFQNNLYFEHLPDNTGVVGLVYYQFIATNQGCSANMSPYQEAASGFDNEKFAGDYGLTLGLTSGTFGANLTFTKTDGATSVAPGGTLTYSGTAANNTGVNLGAPDLGVPLTFNEVIPTGTSFVSGSAADSTSGFPGGTNLTEPTGTGSYTQGFTGSDGILDECPINYQVDSSSFVVLYSNDGGNTFSMTEPSGVTNLRWMLNTVISLDGSYNKTTSSCVAPNGVFDDGTIETSIPTGKSAAFRFQVTVNSVSTPPVICNTAAVGYGSATSDTTAQDCTAVTGNNNLSGTIFKDDGSGGGTFGNGIKDNVSEVGITAGVVVSLYYDLNGDGKFDSGDYPYASTTTSASGTYSFSNLPDGPFVVVVKRYDGTAAPGDGVNNAVDDATYGFVGYGNTTKDPNLPLTTTQGILQLNNTLTTTSLAVNIDLNRATTVAQSLTSVDFAFAPPLQVLKTVPLTTYDEGDVFTYSIVLKNRLPNTGVQGPTGCQYTVWATTGTNGSPANKEFTNPANAWDGPNRTVASADVTGGGLRTIRGSGFTLPQQPGNITKVESLFMGYFNTNLTDDFLNLSTIIGGTTVTGSLSTSLIDSYVGEPATLDPNSAISRDITTGRPGGGAWSFSDFANVSLEVNPTKTSSADQKTFFLDAMGIRVTTDTACESQASSTLDPLPLQDRFDTNSLTFISANPVPTTVSGGTIQWNNVGPLTAGATETISVTMRANDVTGLRTGSCSTLPPTANSACNYAEGGYTGHDVYYSDGRRAQNASASVPVNIQSKGSLRGTVWKDTDNDGWPIEAEPALPNVSVSLYACVQSGGALETGTSNTKICTDITGGNTWRKLASTTTDSTGAYAFLGLDNGYYLIEVGDTDGLVTGGNTSPFSGVQSAEANDIQDASAGVANGHDCTGHGAGPFAACNNVWGDPNAFFRSDQTTINFLNGAAEENITGINFGYQITLATIYGNIWHDQNGNAVRNPEDGDLSGFTVALWSDPNGDGNPADGTLQSTTTSNTDGDYSFTGLAVASYVVIVTPPTLLNNVWTETVESTGGTGSLNNQIPVTVTAGQISGSHDFGYKLASTSSVGDTVYYDFDGDGVQDVGEAGIPNVTVRLYSDVDRDGVIDAGVDAVLATDVTDASGKYLFPDLPLGSYIVVVDSSTLPAAVTQTGDPDINAGRIGDLIYLDSNANATKDSNEDGIAGVVVRLYEDTDQDGTLDVGEPIVASTMTDTNGSYLFTGLNAGKYFVSIDATTLPNTALALTTANPISTVVTLATRTSSDLTKDAGYSPSTNFALGNRIWHDRDGDNVQDAGEVGIPGVTITVTRTTAGVCNPACTTTTGNNGFWMITGLTAGSYTVAASTLPRDFLATSTLATQTISTVDIMTADIGYRYKHGGTVAEIAASPTGTISGRAFRDNDGDLAYDSGEELASVNVNLLDENNVVVASATTASDGTYSFTGVFVGDYQVQAVSTLGTRYSTVFLSAGEAFPNLNVIYNNASETTPDHQSSVSVDGVYADLMQDFGYQRFYGSIGDTVYWDANANATQDFGEPGFSGVTVNLYMWKDAIADGGDNDGVVDAGELTLLSTQTTTADNPLTAQDESGKYLFTNLDEPPTGQKYMVEVVTSTIAPGSTKTLIADPDTDGVPCPSLSAPDNLVCDSRHVVVSGGSGAGFAAGTVYLGADFGYQIVGANYGKIGDRLWIDSDGDGVQDSGEPGIDRVTVFIDADNSGTLNWTDTNANGRWDAGEGERWTETDPDGFYLFSSLADGTYSNLRVMTSDADWPAGLPTTPTFEVRSGNTASRNGIVNVVISGGAVTSIVDGDPGTTDTCTNCDLAVDLGYRYSGTNALSGTVCTDDLTPNGYCGATATTYSGVTPSSETVLSGIQVFLYRWTDTNANNIAWNATTGVIDSGDTLTLIGSTTTDANGDYSFTNVPDNVVVALSVPSTQNLRVTTTNSNTSVEDGSVISRQLYDGYLDSNNNGTKDATEVTVIVRQALNLAGDADDNIKDLDFAFDATLSGTIAKDYGDLPDPAGVGAGPTDFNLTTVASGGASAIAGSLYLGTGVSAEADGKPSSTAAGDDKDDGVAILDSKLVAGSATDCTAGPEFKCKGGIVTVQVSGDGWIVGWMDFNRDGDFDDAGERVISRAFTRFVDDPTTPDHNLTDLGLTQNFAFDVPANLVSDISTGGTLTFFSRFRIYPSEPLLVSASGQALDSQFQAVAGEVEDYQFTTTLAVTRATVTSFVARDMGGQVAVEWETSSEVGTVGFFLKRWNETTAQFEPVNDRLLPSILTPHGGVYRYIDTGAQPGRNYRYQLVEVEASGKRNEKGPYDVNTVVTAEMDVAQLRTQSIEPDPRATGYARAARVGRTPHPSPATSTRTRSGSTVSLAAAAAPSTMKIAVPERGMHYVPQTDLGISSSSKGAYALTSRGSSVAYAPSLDGTGIVFFGEALDSLYARENVYWFGPSDKAGPRMGSRKDSPSRLPSGSEKFTRFQRFEQDLTPAPGLFNETGSDYWLWDFAFSGEGPKPFTFRADGATRSGSASVTVRLKGGSDTEADPDHHVVIRLNGESVGEATWNGLDAVERTFDVPGSLFVNGENTLEIENLADTEAPYSLVYFDSFDVQYETFYRAWANRAEVSSAANAAILISGFTRSDIEVFDVTDALAPVRVTGRVMTVPGGFGVALAPKAANTLYVALTGNAFAAPSGVTRDVPSNLKSATNRGEYVIVTTAAMKDAAQTLANHRPEFSSMVVDIQDVYDEFNFGIADPHALRAFLTRAWTKWAAKPKYVVLAGDGTWDYKDTLGMGNALPPMMVGTPQALFPSDVWFADVAGGAAPEIAIGRLPASTPEELQQVIAKIQMREESSGAGWMNQAIMLSDNPDDAGDFAAGSLRIMSNLPEGTQPIALSVPAPGPEEVRAPLIEEVRTNFINGINAGVGIVNYVGHGGYSVLADEGILWNEDADFLVNSDRQPVMTAMTCLAGNFGLPWIPGLGETLVKKSGGGVAAMWSPTGMSENDHAVTLAESFYASATIKGADTRIGDAILKAMKDYERTIAPQYMLSIYTLLGDPAMKLR